MASQNRFCPIFVLFDYILPKLILASRIDYVRSENFLLCVRIIFRGINYFTSKSIMIKSISIKLILSIINSTKAEPNTH